MADAFDGMIESVYGESWGKIFNMDIWIHVFLFELF